MFLWCLNVGAWSFSFSASSRRLLRDGGLSRQSEAQADAQLYFQPGKAALHFALFDSRLARGER
jgi:hypothetical protein